MNPYKIVEENTGPLEMVKFFLTRTQNPKYGKGLINLIIYIKKKSFGEKNIYKQGKNKKEKEKLEKVFASYYYL